MENRLKRLTGKKVTVTTPNDSFTGKLVFNFGYLNRSEYFVDGYENETFTARDIKSITGNKIKLTKDFDAMESLKSFKEHSQISEKLKRAYGAGLSKSTNAKRAAQFKKQAKMDDDNPAAYKPAPGDKRAKTKPSKHTQKFKQMFGESDLNEAMATLKKESSDAALKKKAKKTGMSLSILRKVFNRGVAAWRTGHRPGTNPTQWGLARVNSFTTKSKGTWGGADKDLAAKVRKSKKESVNEVKTNVFTLNDMDDNDAAVVIAMAKKAGVFLRTKKVSMKRSDVQLKGDSKKVFKFINSLPESVKEFVDPKDVIRRYEVNQSFNSTFQGSERVFKQLKKELNKAGLSVKMIGKPTKHPDIGPMERIIDFYAIGKRIDVKNAQKKLERKYNLSLSTIPESVNENKEAEKRKIAAARERYKKNVERLKDQYDRSKEKDPKRKAMYKHRYKKAVEQEQDKLDTVLRRLQPKRHLARDLAVGAALAPIKYRSAKARIRRKIL